MKKCGFTLVEMLAVLVLLILVSLVVFPSIINYINSSKGDISSVSKKMIISNAELYVSDNKNSFPAFEGHSYCMKLKDLAVKNYIETPFKDSATGEEIDLENTFVKVQYVFDYDLQTTKYNYDVVNSCTAGVADGYVVLTAESGAIKFDAQTLGYTVDDIVDYKIYGNSNGIETLKITTVGKNLFDYDNVTQKSHISKITNGYEVSGYSNILLPTYQTLEEYLGKTVTISFDLETSEDGEFLFYQYQENGIGIEFKTVTKNMTANTPARITLTGKVKNFINNSTYSKGEIIVYKSDYKGSYKMTNIQFELGSNPTLYEPYKETVEMVELTTSLKENDYIEYSTQSMVTSNNSKTIKLPKIDINSDISKIVAVDENSNYSKIELLVRKKLQK